MSVSKAYAVVSTAGLDTARNWYSRLLGREPDRTPMAEVHEWYVGAGGIQLVNDPDRAGKSMVTLIVDDLKQTRAELTSRNLSLGPVSESNYATIAQIEDPDGNQITFAEPGPAQQ